MYRRARPPKKPNETSQSRSLVWLCECTRTTVLCNDQLACYFIRNHYSWLTPLSVLASSFWLLMDLRPSCAHSLSFFPQVYTPKLPSTSFPTVPCAHHVAAAPAARFFFLFLSSHFFSSGLVAVMFVMSSRHGRRYSVARDQSARLDHRCRSVHYLQWRWFLSDPRTVAPKRGGKKRRL